MSLTSYRFGVEIGRRPVGWFTECGGITLEREATPQAEGGVNSYTHQLPGRLKHSNITLKRGVIDYTLWDWFQQGLYDLKVDRRDVSIILYGEDYKPLRRWDMPAAYPVKWAAPNLKSDSNQIAIETLVIGYGSGGGPTIQRQEDEAAPDEEAETGLPAIDMTALAEKVYQLLKTETRIERERTGIRYR